MNNYVGCYAARALSLLGLLLLHSQYSVLSPQYYKPVYGNAPNPKVLLASIPSTTTTGQYPQYYGPRCYRAIPNKPIPNQ
eukprot:3224599-Rhodomonas_salina.1